ncbi:hypothetical protein ACE3MZ_13040 [Paenibacillus sp. WLX1005]|uniref:hypothetical protein n=1 Tax=Paenibacillus sp. WLX1005 TaxID=3243766 RepID=UPI0039843692
MEGSWAPILSATASTISAAIAFLSLSRIRAENKKTYQKDLKIKRQYLISYLKESHYIYNAIYSISTGDPSETQKGRKTILEKAYNIEFPTPAQYGEYFDVETASSLRGIQAEFLEHYSNYWYCNDTNQFSDGKYKTDEDTVINAAKSSLCKIKREIKLLEEISKKKYNGEVKLFDKKWFEELWRFLK